MSKRTVIGCLVFVAVTLALWATRPSANTGTKRWALSVDDRVTVIDTRGVCLYILGWGYQGGIAAVPKPQLPMGAGCE